MASEADGLKKAYEIAVAEMKKHQVHTEARVACSLAAVAIHAAYEKALEQEERDGK